jgi:hypothetical protein
VFPVRYELGSYIPEDGILHSHRGENLKPAGPCSGDVICLLCGMKCVLISQKTAFFIVTAVKASNLIQFKTYSTKNNMIPCGT